MDLRRLPPAMVLALGLGACGDDGSQESDAGPCLSIGEEVGTATSTSTSTSTTSDSTGTTSSSTGADDTTFGPCLGIDPSNTSDSTGMTGSGSGSGSESGSGSGSESGSGSSSSGAMDAQEPESPTRADAARRVIERGTLPADVAARLRALTEEH